jgi:hypothetical protein
MKATDAVGSTLDVLSLSDVAVETDRGRYHPTKLFHNGIRLSTINRLLDALVNLSETSIDVTDINVTQHPTLAQTFIVTIDTHDEGNTSYPDPSDAYVRRFVDVMASESTAGWVFVSDDEND